MSSTLETSSPLERETIIKLKNAPYALDQQTEWILEPGSVNKFKVEVTDTVFCTYFRPLNADAPGSMKVRPLRKGADGNFDGAVGSSVAHGDSAQPKLGGYSDPLSVPAGPGIIFGYQIAIVQGETTEPQPYIFWVEAFPTIQAADDAKLSDLAKRAT